jgi:PAS domain S-box-containing protein
MKRTKPNVPIILLSGTSSVPEPLLHADSFLSKTEGPEQLLEAVEQLLSHHSASTDASAEPPRRMPLQELLASIVEDSDDAILSKTLDGTILTWNKSAERMYGYRPEEVIGQNVSMLLPPDRPKETHEILERLKRGEKIDRYETRRRTKDGRVLFVSVTISPVRDAQGTIIGILTRDQLIGDGEVIFVNLAKKSGVEVGNRMYIVRRGDAKPDRMTNGVGQDDRRFPARALGEVVVVEVGDKISVCLVTLSVQEMGAGDIVMMQKSGQ